MTKTNYIHLFLGIGIYLFYSTIGFAQFNRTKNWVLGDSLLLDFNSNPPTLGVSALKSHEGYSVISDLNGQLLFYTNGVTVWNAQHQVMSNGSGLNSDVSLSTTDAAVIIPLPGSNHIYYIFTVGSAGGNPNASGFGGVAYSIVDMDLDGGLGEVTQKNVVIHPSPLSTEKLCATQHANGIDYWIMTHDCGNNQFRTFLLTSNGVQPNPVISKVGMHITSSEGRAGNMRFAPSGCKLALAITGYAPLDTIEVFDFDKNTGYVHNAMQLNFMGGWTLPPEDFHFADRSYGICFSPDNTKLYVSSENSIVQFDLSSNNAHLIQQSRYPIASSFATPYFFYNMQIAPNGKMYIARCWKSFVSSNYYSIIEFPNQYGAACQFIEQGITFPSYKSKAGLPNFISNFLVPDSTPLATCSPYCPELALGKDTIVCHADSFLIALDLPKGTILWNHLDTSFDFTVTYSGEYFAAYDFNGCPTQYDTIRVSFVQNPLPVYADTVFCKGDTLFFTLPIESETTYLLNEAPINPLFAIDTSGNFQITAKKESCVFTTTFKVMDICDTLLPPPLDTFEVLIPNVFTPNGDGENDIFTIQQKMVRELTFIIYNRWGKEVHRMQTFPTQKDIIIWDGNGASEGTYFYTASFIDWQYKTYEKKGFIQIFK